MDRFLTSKWWLFLFPLAMLAVANSLSGQSLRSLPVRSMLPPLTTHWPHEIRALQKEIDEKTLSAETRRVPIYRYFAEEDNSIQWNSVEPDADDRLLASGEAVVINHQLRRLHLEAPFASGEGRLVTDYYFRAEGSLALMRSETHLTGVTPQRVDTILYDARGRILQKSRRYTGPQPISGFPNVKPVLYRKAANFLKLLYPIDILTEW